MPNSVSHSISCPLSLKIDRDTLNLPESQAVIDFDGTTARLLSLVGPYGQNSRWSTAAQGFVAAPRGNHILIEGCGHRSDPAPRVLEMLYAQAIAVPSASFAGEVEGAIRAVIAQSSLPSSTQVRQAHVSDALRGASHHCRRAPPRRTPICARWSGTSWCSASGRPGPARPSGVAHAAQLLERGKVERIILSRPAVEAGERLGFLPGDYEEKVDPYLRPLYDALYD